MVVAPPSDAITVADPVSLPGLYFSPIEAGIYNALGAGPLSAKALARACGQKYTPKIRTLLHNLLEREVLVYDRASGGYRRVTVKPR